MSRGLGKIQRATLEVVEAHRKPWSLSTHAVAKLINASRYFPIQRGLARLVTEGLIPPLRGRAVDSWHTREQRDQHTGEWCVVGYKVSGWWPDPSAQWEEVRWTDERKEAHAECCAPWQSARAPREAVRTLTSEELAWLDEVAPSPESVPTYYPLEYTRWGSNGSDGRDKTDGR